MIKDATLENWLNKLKDINRWANEYRKVGPGPLKIVFFGQN